MNKIAKTLAGAGFSLGLGLSNMLADDLKLESYYCNEFRAPKKNDWCLAVYNKGVVELSDDNRDGKLDKLYLNGSEIDNQKELMYWQPLYETMRKKQGATFKK